MKKLFTILTALALAFPALAQFDDSEALLMASASPASGVAPPDIYWNEVNDGSGAVATATVGPNADLAGSYTWDTFSGSGFIHLDGGAAMQTASAVTYGANVITLGVWLYFDATDSTRFLFESSANAGTTANTFAVYISGGKIIGYVSGTTGSRSEAINVPATGSWFYLTVVLDNSTATGDVRMWFDNVEQTMDDPPATDNKTGTSNYAAEVLYINSRAGSSFFGDTDYDDIRIGAGSLSALISAWKNDRQ